MISKSIENPIPSPPWSGVGKKIESLIRKALYEMELPQDGKIALALSGGKDSLTLLLHLMNISGKGFPSFDLHAIYISGEFSCGPSVTETFLKGFCEKLDIPLTVVPTHQKLDDLNCYSCSRLRRKHLFETAKGLGYTNIAFGHHQDDSNQTLLLNLLHKGEFAALLPEVFMQDYGVKILRPMIYVSESDILTFARQGDFLRLTCQCPVGQNSMRKKVARLIEEIEDLFPHVRGNLAHAAKHYGSDKASKP